MNILYYINQFFGQIGGEEKADYPFEVREEVLGPSIAMSRLLDKGNKISATIICGDNYAVKNEELLTKKITDIIKNKQINLVVAGPAFNAGRYGMACGMVCKIAFFLGVPAVSGMFEENPGREVYGKYGYIFPTSNNASGMRKAMPKMANFVNKLCRGEDVFDSETCGYFTRGIRHYYTTEKTGAVRSVDMMLKKVKGEAFETELKMPEFHMAPISPAIKDLSKAKIALVTTCGVVPEGNPDHIEAHAATVWGEYKIEDYGGIEMKDTFVAHGGYTPVYATNNGNRAIPVDAAVELEKEGYIGKLYEKFMVTVGNCMPVDRAEKIGEGIAQELKEAGVDGVLLTSA